MKNARPKVVEPNALAAILGMCDAREHAILTLSYKTGMRIGELCWLRTKDLRREKGYLEVPEEGKTGYRKVYLPEHKSLNDSLDAWERERPTSEFYFSTRDGLRPVHPNSVRRALKRICYQLWGGTAIHPKVLITPHMLRHTWASERLHEGMDLLTVQKQLGHSRPDVTLRTYCHAMDRHVEAAIHGWRE